VLADLVVDLFVAQVELGPKAGGIHRRLDLGGITVGIAGNGGDHNLHRGQPERESAGAVLDQHADETLHGAENGAMEHDRAMFLPVLADVIGIQALGRMKSAARAMQAAGRWYRCR